MNTSLLLALALLVTVQAYTYRWRINVIDNKCVMENTTRANGEEWYDDEKCERYTCDVQAGLIDAAGCGSIGLPGPECKLVSGTGHYPDCCKRPDCNFQTSV